MSVFKAIGAGFAHIMASLLEPGKLRGLASMMEAMRDALACGAAAHTRQGAAGHAWAGVQHEWAAWM
jgi:hypothetical protein